MAQFAFDFNAATVELDCPIRDFKAKARSTPRPTIALTMALEELGDPLCGNAGSMVFHRKSWPWADKNFYGRSGWSDPYRVLDEIAYGAFDHLGMPPDDHLSRRDDLQIDTAVESGGRQSRRQRTRKQ